MGSLSVNASWCRAFVSAIVKAGVRSVAICPGARSAALVAELAGRTDLRLAVYTDERAGAFFALGAALEAGAPTVVLTTSGSAVANATPALSEAYATGAPLILVSCDRPVASRGMGRPQTMDQVALCRSVVVGSLDLSEPSDSSEAIQAMSDGVEALVERARSTRLPAHINVPLLGNRTSTDSEDGSGTPAAPAAGDPGPGTGLSAAEVRQRIADAGLGREGLIIAGPDRLGVPVAALAAFAARCRLPLICDTPARSGDMAAELIETGDLLLAMPEHRARKPDVLIRFGSAPISNDVQTYIGEIRAPTVHITDGKFERDYLSPNALGVRSPDPAFMDGLASVLAPAEPAWLESWSEANRRARRCYRAAVARAGWSELQAVDCLVRQAGLDFLSVSNSLSVRLVNLLCIDEVPVRPVFVNRGLSGIDGNLSTFLGVLAANGGTGAAVIGDLAFLHDLTSLEFFLHSSADCIVLVLNNSGAGLFDLLPLQNVPDYGRLVRNSIEYRIAAIAEAFSVPHLASTCLADLEAALADYRGGPLIVEAKFTADAARRGLKRFTQSMMVDLQRARS